MLFFAVVFFAPDMGGYFLEHANFAAADPLVTPDHIAPVWYMTPFYAMLRSIPNKLFGVLVMGGAVIILLFLPWLDKSPVRAMRYKGTYSKLALLLFTITFFVLGYLGTISTTPITLNIARVCTGIYFSYFLFMPFYTRREQCQPVPERIG
jgi:ubiquinol-cytochrome c reductase cytochrome b subunit